MNRVIDGGSRARELQQMRDLGQVRRIPAALPGANASSHKTVDGGSAPFCVAVRATGPPALVARTGIFARDKSRDELVGPSVPPAGESLPPPRTPIRRCAVPACCLLAKGHAAQRTTRCPPYCR